METTGAGKNIRMFIEKIIKDLKTELVVGNEKYGLVNIRREIFQDDALLSLLLVIAMIPLSVILKKTAKDANKISHLLYIDNLKLYGISEIKIQSLTNAI